MGWYYNPPPPHIGAAQPLTPKKLTPPSGPSNPVFGRPSLAATLVAAWSVAAVPLPQRPAPVAGIWTAIVALRTPPQPPQPYVWTQTDWPQPPRQLFTPTGPAPANPPIGSGAAAPQAALIAWIPPPPQPLIAHNLSPPITGLAPQAPPLWVRAPIELAGWATVPWLLPQRGASFIPASPQPVLALPRQAYWWGAPDWPQPLRRFLIQSGPAPANPPISGGAKVPQAVLISWLPPPPPPTPPTPPPWKVTEPGTPTIPDWSGGNVWWITTSSNPGGRAWVSIGVGPNPTHQTRLRSLYLVLSGTTAGLATMVVRDGPTQMGTIIFEADLYTAANSGDFLDFNEIDLRASAGNVLTVEFVAGIPGDVQEINAEGDFVAPGTRYGV